MNLDEQVIRNIRLDAPTFDGSLDPKVYNDWEGVEELLTLPDHAFHRNVDKLVLEAAATHEDLLKVALVCPPTIYGEYSPKCNRSSPEPLSLFE